MTAAKVTISKRRGDNSVISIAIHDDASALLVAEVELPLDLFAECVTGLASCQGEFVFAPSEFTARNIGKEREIKHVIVQWDRSRHTMDDLHNLIEPHLVDGWMLKSDGTSSRQKQGGHVVVLYRFVKTEE